jgi:hypothetical protein
MLTSRTQHGEALHEHGPILGGEFVPVPLARVCDEAAHLGVVLGAWREAVTLVTASRVSMWAVWNSTRPPDVGSHSSISVQR